MSFTRFTDLPTELRLMIWEAAEPFDCFDQPRITLHDLDWKQEVTVDVDSEVEEIWRFNARHHRACKHAIEAYVPLMHVNQEASYIASKWAQEQGYEICINTDNPGAPPKAIRKSDTSYDILYIPAERILENFVYFEQPDVVQGWSELSDELSVVHHIAMPLLEVGDGHIINWEDILQAFDNLETVTVVVGDRQPGDEQPYSLINAPYQCKWVERRGVGETRWFGDPNAFEEMTGVDLNDVTDQVEALVFMSLKLEVSVYIAVAVA